MLVVNSLVEWVNDENAEDSVIERILWMDRVSDLLYVINVNSNDLPYPRKLFEYEEAFESGAAIKLDKDHFIKIINEREISEKAKELRDKAWEAICSVVEVEPEIYFPSSRGKFIKKVSEKHGLSEKAIYKYLKRYWVRGKTINSLLPDYEYCGGAGKDKTVTDKKRGRPRKLEGLFGNGINVDEDIRRIFKTAINKYYYNSAKLSLMLCYELMRRDYFSENSFEDGKKSPLLKPSSEVPTFGQFRYWFEKERNIKKEVSSRFSPKKYEQEYRPILGRSSMDAVGPGSLVLIDATIADVYLVSRFNRRNHIIGRPVLYILQDVYSRSIVGLSVSLEGPSWMGAALAITNMVKNKVEFCKEFGVEIEEEDWPMHFLPQTILADRGEMLSGNAESMIMNLGITVKNTPPYRGDWKPLIERHFKLTNERTKPFLPGAINPDFRERGGKDYRLDAKLDIMQFTQIIIKCILFHNNQYQLSNYNKDELMIADEVPLIPREIWNWGIKNKMGKLRKMDEEVVKLNLMPNEEGIVTAKGIRFKGLFYGSKASMKEQWFVKARSRGSWKVSISYDPRNVSYIYIKKSATEFEKCYLLEYQSAFKGKYLEEVEYLMGWEKVQQTIGKDDELQAKTDLISDIESIVKEAKSQTNKELILSDESDTQRTKNIRENRQKEKLLNREKDKFELDKQVSENTTEVVSFKKQEESENDIMRLLRQKQREAFGGGSSK